MAQQPAPPAKAETPAATVAAEATPAAPAAPLAPGAKALTAADVEVWLDGYMPYALQRGDVAGAVVVIVKDGKVLFQKGYGYSDAATRTPVDAERTAFRPGSVSKLFTWTAVMQLVEQGKIDLDRDVNDYLDFKIPPRDGKPVTMRNIMTHTAGFEEAFKGLITTNVANVGLEKTLKQWVPERAYAPGSTPAYSNYATGIAGYIVERLSGKSFDDYIDQNIFAPLGMQNSSFRQPLPEKVAALMSKGYPQGSVEPKPYEYVSLAPAGSLAATGSDMAKFMIAHLQNGSYNGAQILKPETAKLMHDTPNTILPRIHRMLLGFYEQDMNGHRIISHGGDTQLFHSELNLFVNDNIGIFFSGNSTGKEGGVGPVRSQLLRQFAERYLPGPGPAVEPGFKPDPAHAQAAAGTYDNSRRGSSTFLAAFSALGQYQVLANGDGTLSVAQIKDLAGAPKKWTEIAPYVWKVADANTLLSVKVENGAVTRFGMDGLPFMVFDRTPASHSMGWIKPATIASIAAMLLTLLAWPATVLVRRHYGGTFPLSGRAAQAHRAVRIGAILALLVLGGWFLTITSAFGLSGALANSVDTKLLLLQLSGWVAFVAAVVTAGWNAYVVWTGQRSWFAKVWSIVLVLSALVIFWTMLSLKLLAVGTSY